MCKKAFLSVLLVLVLQLPLAIAQDQTDKRSTFRLDSLQGLEFINVKAEVANYLGRPSLHVIDAVNPAADPVVAGGSAMVLLPGSNFKDGTIEISVAGAPRAGSPEGARGFIGIAFRVRPHASRYECLYIRPTNGRADDQLRRNHSTQYISYPDFPWQRLRKENPGVYESYVDLQPRVWTKLKVEVSGTKAWLSVNGADQPCLIVNDLKLGEAAGQIALWVGTDTEGHFSDLVVRQRLHNDISNVKAMFDDIKGIKINK